MNTMIACCAICAALFAGLAFYHNRRPNSERPVSIGGSACLGLCFGIIAGLIVGGIIRKQIPMVETSSEQVSLAAIRSLDAPTGTFIWSSGDFSSRRTYMYYVRHADGSVSPGQMDADPKLRILEDAELKNEGTFTVYRRERDPTSPLIPWATLSGDDNRITKYVFRVPAGTVLQKFSVN